MTPLERETIRTVAVALEKLVPHACAGRFCEVCTPGVFAATLVRMLDGAPIEMTKRNGQHVRAANGGAAADSKPDIRMPPARRVPPQALSGSLFDSVHLVEGRWVRLGSMTKADCYSAAAQYDRVATQASHRSAAFRKLAGALSAGTRTIEQSLTREKLVHILGGSVRAEMLTDGGQIDG